VSGDGKSLHRGYQNETIAHRRRKIHQNFFFGADKRYLNQGDVTLVPPDGENAQRNDHEGLLTFLPRDSISSFGAADKACSR
jgi:hypothetical protein